MPSHPDRLLLAASAFGAGLAAGLLLAPVAGGTARRQIDGAVRRALGAGLGVADRLVAPAARAARAARSQARRLADRHVPLASDFDLFDARDIEPDLRAGRD